MCLHFTGFEPNASTISSTDDDRLDMRVPLTLSLSTSATSTYDFLSEDYVLQSVGLSARDFLEQYTQMDFLDSNFDFVDVMR